MFQMSQCIERLDNDIVSRGSAKGGNHGKAAGVSIERSVDETPLRSCQQTERAFLHVRAFWVGNGTSTQVSVDSPACRDGWMLSKTIPGGADDPVTSHRGLMSVYSLYQHETRLGVRIRALHRASARHLAPVAHKNAALPSNLGPPQTYARYKVETKSRLLARSGWPTVFGTGTPRCFPSRWGTRVLWQLVSRLEDSDVHSD